MVLPAAERERGDRLSPAAGADGWTRVDWYYATPLFMLALLLAFSQSRFLAGIPGDPGDPRFNIAILEHVYRWTVGLEPSLWSPRFFYPYPDALAFSDNHFGSAPFYIGLRLLGLDRYQAFSGWFAFGWALNFIAGCYVLRRLGFSGLASGVGAFLFACSLPVTAQLSHAQLTYRFAAPLALLALHLLINNRDLKQVGWLAFWVTVQFYCTIYIGFFLVFLILAWLVALYLVRLRNAADPTPHRAIADAWRLSSMTTRLGTAVVLLAALGLTGYLLGYYQLVASHYGFVRSYTEIATMLPRLFSYFQADHSLIWRDVNGLLPRPPMFWEHRLFIGAGALALVVVGAIKGRSHLVNTALVAVVILIVLTLSVSSQSLYRFLFALPGFNAIRAVSRIWFVEAIPLAILAATAVDRLTGGRLRLGPDVRLTAPILIALMIIESAAIVPSYSKRPDLLAMTDAVRAKVPSALPADAILFVKRPPSEPDVLTNLTAMIVAQDLGLATLNGYSGNFPPGFDPPQNAGCQAGANQLAAYVRFAHLDTAAFDALKQRVVPIGFDHCDPLAWQMPAG